MEYPHCKITASSPNEDAKAFVYLHVQSEFFPIDEAALTAAVQQWLLGNVPEVIATTAERREQTYPVTPLPPLPA
jgi:hypothetical protein